MSNEDLTKNQSSLFLSKPLIPRTPPPFEYTPLYDDDGNNIPTEASKSQKTDEPIFPNVTLRKHKNPEPTTNENLNKEEETDKTKIKTRISCQILQNSQILKDADFLFDLPDNILKNNQEEADLKSFFETKIPNFQKLFEDSFCKQETKSNRRNSQNYDTWSVDSNMPIPIKDITDLIKEYKGEAKELNSFIKNIDRLWTYIDAYDIADKERFLLVLQLKLIDKAADATKNVTFQNWQHVKQALKDNINPQKNIEKAELKLSNIKQKEKEDIETFSKRVEEALEDFNKSFNLEEENEVLKKENDRKARKAFENGLTDSQLRNKAIMRGNKTLRDSVDYVIEQELRQSEVKPRAFSNKFCSYCKLSNHNFSECRKRQASTASNSNTKPTPSNANTSANNEITCYKCLKKGHYASSCRSSNNNSNQHSPTNPNNSSNGPRISFSTNDANNSNNNTSHNNNSRQGRDRGNETKNSRNVRFYENDFPIEEAAAYVEANSEPKN